MDSHRGYYSLKPHPPRKTGLKNLQDRLGYRFGDASLLDEALTHSSAHGKKVGGRDYERLEFVGDRVLGLAVSALILSRAPGISEGELATRYNALVKQETCAAIAEQWEVFSVLNMARSARSEERTRAVILSDVCEAILGAIFLEAGFDVVRDIVWRWWEPFLNLDQPAQRDAKTLLQEYAQSRRLGLPRYRTVSKTGPDHSPHFIVEVAIQGEGPVLGEGSSQKIAQQAAAGALLTKLGAWERCVELEESHE